MNTKLLKIITAIVKFTEEINKKENKKESVVNGKISS